MNNINLHDCPNKTSCRNCMLRNIRKAGVVDVIVFRALYFSAAIPRHTAQNRLNTTFSLCKKKRTINLLFHTNINFSPISYAELSFVPHISECMSRWQRVTFHRQCITYLKEHQHVVKWSFVRNGDWGLFLALVVEFKQKHLCK